METLRPNTKPAEDERESLAADFFGCGLASAVAVAKVDGPAATGTVTITGFATADAEGILFCPEGIALMSLEVTLNLVCANEISLLSCCQSHCFNYR